MTEAMGLLTWIVIGFIAGVIALQLRSRGGNKTAVIMLTISILGAAAAGWWSTSFGLEWGTLRSFNYLSTLTACAGAALPLIAYSLLFGLRQVSRSSLAED